MEVLGQYSRNEYSQHGEDGIIERLLELISQNSDLDKWCVEFGAWDGVYLSNTCNLIKRADYNAVLIEGNAKKYEELCDNFPQVSVRKFNRFVSLAGKDSLDSILSETDIPSNFDFLSIDIDGCDYHIFDSLEHYIPKTICVEFNPTIPNSIEFVQDQIFYSRSESKEFGASCHAKTV